MGEVDSLSGATIAVRGIEPPAAFAVEEEAGLDGVATVLLRGELDIAAVSAVRRRIDVAAGRRGLVVDLAEVTFVDSAILKELLRANAELSRTGVRLVLAAVPSGVQRLLDLTRTAELFEAAPDRAAALARF